MHQFSILTALLLLSTPFLAFADPETTYQSTSTTTVIITLSSVTAYNTVTVTGSPPSTTTTLYSTPSSASSSSASTVSTHPVAKPTYPYSSSNSTGNGTGNANPSGGHISPLPFEGAASASRGSFAVAMFAACAVTAIGAVL